MANNDCGIDLAQLPVDFEDMDLDMFLMWTEPALKSFLALRKKNTEGDFKTLAARAFNAYEEKVPVDPDKEEQHRRLQYFYQEKLKLPPRFHGIAPEALPTHSTQLG